jgi:uncharacterized protein YukE
MSTPAQIGKNEYQAALAKARQANRDLRRILRRINQETNSNLIRALVGDAALVVSDNDEAMERLDEIGKTLKDSK